MSTPSSITVTPGTGKTVATRQDAASKEHPVGILEFEPASGDPVLVSAANPLPTTLQGNAANAPLYVSPGTGAKFDVVPASPAAGSYLPVRLTDGTSFYTASGGTGGGGGQQYAEDAAHTSGDLGTLALGVRKDTAVSLENADGDYSPLLTDSTGRLHVNPGTVAVTGTFWQATQPVSLAVMPALAAGTNVIGHVVVDSSGLPAGASTELTLAALSAKVPALGQAAANASVPVVLTATQLATLTPPTTVNATAQAGTSGGATPFHLTSAASTNPTSVKAAAGQVFSVQLVNRSTTAAAYVKLFDKASAPTVGTDTVKKAFCLPAAASASQPTVLVHGFPTPIAFATGVALAITGGTGLDGDTAAVAANDVTCDIDFK